MFCCYFLTVKVLYLLGINNSGQDLLCFQARAKLLFVYFPNQDLTTVSLLAYVS